MTRSPCLPPVWLVTLIELWTCSQSACSVLIWHRGKLRHTRSLFLLREFRTWYTLLIRGKRNKTISMTPEEHVHPLPRAWCLETGRVCGKQAEGPGEMNRGRRGNINRLSICIDKNISALEWHTVSTWLSSAPWRITGLLAMLRWGFSKLSCVE